MGVKVGSDPDLTTDGAGFRWLDRRATFVRPLETRTTGSVPAARKEVDRRW